MALNILPPIPSSNGEKASSLNNQGNVENTVQNNLYTREPSEVLTNRVYVGNLRYEIDDRDLYYFFYQFGPVHHARVITNRGGYSKGYGFVTFSGPEVARKFLERRETENIWLKGRKLRIGAARLSYWMKVGGRQESNRSEKHNSQSEEDGSENVETNGFLRIEPQEVPVENSTHDDSTSNYQSTSLDQTASLGTYSTPTSHQVIYYPTYPQMLEPTDTNMASYPFPFSCQEMASQSYPGTMPSIYQDPYYFSYSMYQCPDMILTDQSASLPYYLGNYMCMVTNDNQQYSNAVAHGEYITYKDIYQGDSTSYELPETSFHYYQGDLEARVDHSDSIKSVLQSIEGPQLGDSGFQESSWNESSKDHNVDIENVDYQELSQYKIRFQTIVHFQKPYSRRKLLILYLRNGRIIIIGTTVLRSIKSMMNMLLMLRRLYMISM